MNLLATLLLASSPLTAPIGAEPPGDGAPAFDHAFVFLDRGALRVAWRGATAGRDDGLVDVIYGDAQSHRTTRARVGRGAIVKVHTSTPADLFATLAVEPQSSLLLARGLWLVESSNPDEDGLALAARLTDSVRKGIIDEAFPNLHLRHKLAASISIPPDDPRYVAQFFLEDIGIEGAWALGVGDPGVVITVVDNGCDLDHPDLVAKFDPGHDVVDGDDLPTFFPNGETNEHGTACAGLIAAVTDNGTDVAGVCPLCRLSCTRLLAGDTEATPLDADVRAFAFAIEDDVAIVSNSWGFVDAIPVPGVLADAIEEAAENGRGGKGAIVVFAAGNDSRAIAEDELLAVDGVIGVGAVNNLGELTQFSNTGPSVDIVAPTGAVTTDISGSDGGDAGDVTTQFGGTSSACPLVAGVAGLLLGFAPDLTRAEVEEILEETAKQSVLASPDESGHDDEYGFGLVQPEAALLRTVDPPPGIGGGAGCDCGDDRGAAALVLFLGLSQRKRRRRTRH